MSTKQTCEKNSELLRFPPIIQHGTSMYSAGVYNVYLLQISKNWYQAVHFHITKLQRIDMRKSRVAFVDSTSADFLPVLIGTYK